MSEKQKISENLRRLAKQYAINNFSIGNGEFYESAAEPSFISGFLAAQKEYEEKLRWNSPNIKPKLSDKDSMFSVNVSIRVESGEYEYSGYYNFSTYKWLIYPKEEPFEFELITGWRYFL